MTKKILSLVFSIIFVLLISSSVSSVLTATIGNPKMVLYKNITAGDSLKFQNTVIVDNKNDFPADIEISPQGDWKDRISLLNPKFTLPAGERRPVNYTIDLLNSPPGYYQGDVLVIFTGGNETNSLSLAQDLAVVTYLDSSKKSEGISIGMKAAIALILFLIVLIIILANKKPKGRKKK